MIYEINERPPVGKLLLFSLQIMLAVFTATALIAQVCGVNMGGAFVGAGVSTLIYGVATKFKSPMFISNSGAFVVPVITAMAAGGYSAIAVGGIVSALVYCILGLIFTKVPVNSIYKVFPKVLIGSVTMVIGINLMKFIPSYIGESQICLWVALFTVLVIAVASKYMKGALSLFPFLIGTLAGYVLSIPLGLVDFSVFDGVKLFQVPSFAFMQLEPVKFATLIPIIVMYTAYGISAVMECLSDHAALGNIIGKDLYREPGLSRIFIGEGLSNITGTLLGGLGQCSYGEGIACVGFSRCASVYTTIGAAIMMILLGFIGPVQAFIASIPSCVIGGGTAIILYGFISNSGVKMLQGVDFKKAENIILNGAVLALGTCGIKISIGGFELKETALALVGGVLLNYILSAAEKRKEKYFALLEAKDALTEDEAMAMIPENDNGKKSEIVEL